MFREVILWLKKEKILLISGLCAILTMFFVPPDNQYAGYIDIRVLVLLFCLMAVIGGFQKCGAFRWLAADILGRSTNGRTLGFCLVMLPFFSSMIVTNDVALLTFVPFTIVLLKEVNCTGSVIPVLTFQTLAANLGSMSTPIGNPHNLFLYTTYNLTTAGFFEILGPLSLISFIFLGIASLFVLPKALPYADKIEINETISSYRGLTMYTVLFALCIMTVIKILPYPALFIAVLLTVLLADRDNIRNPDYGLLLTFICFFIVSGNLGRLDAVQNTIEKFLDESTLITSLLTSQIISNVPASVLLSGFTDNWQELLKGVNIGGLGTPVASLASLITVKIYFASDNPKTLKFMAFFTVANIAGIIILLVFNNLLQ